MVSIFAIIVVVTTVKQKKVNFLARTGDIKKMTYLKTATGLNASNDRREDCFSRVF